MAFIAVAYVMLLFGYAVVAIYFAPPEWAVFTVFDVSYRNNNQTTVILTYGEGKYVLQGHHTLQLDHTYHLVYKTTPGFKPSKVISIEEVKD